MQRRRFKQILTFPDRLANEAARLRDEAERLPQGRSATSFSRRHGRRTTPSKWITGFGRLGCSRPSSGSLTTPRRA